MPLNCSKKSCEDEEYNDGSKQQRPSSHPRQRALPLPYFAYAHKERASLLRIARN
jgi:hypothetical protein